MEFFEAIDFYEDQETSEYNLEHDDHGEAFLEKMLSLSEDEFRFRSRMNQRTFLSFSELVIFYD